MSSLTMQETFAFVILQPDNSYSVINLNLLEKLDACTRYKEDHQYKIVFKGRKYDCIVKLIGSYEECNEALNQTIIQSEYPLSENMKQTRSRKRRQCTSSIEAKKSRPGK